MIEKLKEYISKLKAEANRNADIYYSVDDDRKAISCEGEILAYEKILSAIDEIRKSSEGEKEVENDECNRTVEEVDVPNNIEEAIKALDVLLSDEDKHYLKTDPKAAIMVHHTLGRWIRNNWGLWQEEHNALKTLFTNIGIEHPDDMSNEIIEKYIEYLEKK